MTSIKISYVDPTGYESFWNTLNSAFGDHAPLLDALYPQRGTARGDQSAIKRLQKRSTDDDNDLYCIEASIENKPAGAAIWSVRRTPPTGDLVKDEYVDRESGLWDKESHAFAQGLWEVYVEGRIKTINETKSEGKPTWSESVFSLFSTTNTDPVLEWLAVLPSARKKGVGEALVAWGRDKADENGDNVSCSFWSS